VYRGAQNSAREDALSTPLVLELSMFLQIGCHAGGEFWN
jgi:hypothetical protein